MTAQAVPPARAPARLVVVAVALVVLTNGPILFVSRRLFELEPSWEGPFVRPVLVATSLTAVALVVLGLTEAEGRRLRPPSPVAALAVGWFTSWAVLSTFWSVDPGVTRSRAVLYIGLAALAWIIADLDPRRVRLAVLGTALFGVGVSLIAVVTSDVVALDFNDDWRGIYTNRNSLAPLAAIAALLAGTEALERRGPVRLVASGVVVAGLGVLYQTGSRTALFALCIAVGGATLVVVARKGHGRHGRRGILPAVGAGAAGFAVAGVAVWSLWDDPTLTQRRTIWDLVWDKSIEQPFHGHGWFVMWGDPDFTGMHILLQRGSAHSSFFDVFLGVGVVGLAAFVAVVVLALAGAVRDVWRAPSAATWAWLALVGFLVVENVTESFVLWFSYNWVLLMAAALRSGVRWPRRLSGRTPRPSDAVIG